MKILRDGDKHRLLHYYKFECSKCGCIFIACTYVPDESEDDDQCWHHDTEYTVFGKKKYDEYGAYCPCCDECCYSHTKCNAEGETLK